MARSLKKGPYVDPNIEEKVKEIKKGKKKIKTWARDSMITPDMIGHVFNVYDGRNFVEVRPTEEMVGHKLGEFAPSTKFSRHGGRIQRELERRAKEAERERRKREKLKE